MTIEVRTAAPGCAERCPYFEVEVRDLYANNNKYIRAYRCAHVNRCEALAQILAEKIAGETK